MRLLFVGTNRGAGGTETHGVTLARALADAGHEVAAVVAPGDFLHEELAEDGRIALYPACFETRNDVRATRAVVRAARTVRPDWMVGMFKREYWPLAVAARLLRTPVALFSHLDQRFSPFMARALPRVVQRVIAPSAYQRERLLARGMPAHRVSVLHNPIDTARFHPDPALRAASRARLGFAADDVVVGYAGRLDAGKGTDVLLAALDRAMARDPRLRALWVARGAREEALRAALDASPFADRHVWHPWTRDPHPLYTAMDVLALPSVAPETFGRTLAEAQACGVPVLGSGSGGIPEALEDGVTGRLVAPGDVGAWSDALLALADCAEARRRMGSAGRAFVVRRFEAVRIAAAFAGLLAG